MPAPEEVVARLEAGGFEPKSAGTGKWLARCPAHDDRSPSLSVSAAPGGKVLAHCFAGCGYRQVMDALGFKGRASSGEDPATAARPSPPRTPRTSPSPAHDWPAVAARFEAQADDERINRLADMLSVDPAALRALRCGWAEREDLRPFTREQRGSKGGGWTFPMTGEDGTIVGINVRCHSGFKWTLGGARLGLFVPRGIADRPGQVLVVEGASDTAAAWGAGHPAIGRPSAAVGAAIIAALFRDRDLLIVGENDAKADGRWPGREGAERVAREIGKLTGRTPPLAFPPAGAKDLRDMLAQERKAAR